MLSEPTFSPRAVFQTRRAVGFRARAVAALCSGLVTIGVSGQAPVSGPPAFIVDAYPDRATNPEAVERGRALFMAYGCAFCHGPDIRGGNGGPSLLRSQLVQRDVAGETIGPVIRGGVPNTLMTGFALDDNELVDIAEFLHSFDISSRDPARNRPETIVTGDAAAGRRYFDAHCGGCHSVRDDLLGIGGRYEDARDLQTNWLMPRNPPPTIARVIMATGEIIEGTLAHIDEFMVSVVLESGWRQSFQRRSADDPRVELRDPLAAHKQLLTMYTDADIHNVTAYLTTIE